MSDHSPPSNASPASIGDGLDADIIEKPRQLLIALGCRAGQGFLFYSFRELPTSDTILASSIDEN